MGQVEEDVADTLDEGDARQQRNRGSLEPNTNDQTDQHHGAGQIGHDHHPLAVPAVD